MHGAAIIHFRAYCASDLAFFDPITIIKEPWMDGSLSLRGGGGTKGSQSIVIRKQQGWNDSLKGVHLGSR